MSLLNTNTVLILVGALALVSIPVVWWMDRRSQRRRELLPALWDEDAMGEAGGFLEDVSSPIAEANSQSLAREERAESKDGEEVLTPDEGWTPFRGDAQEGALPLKGKLDDVSSEEPEPVSSVELGPETKSGKAPWWENLPAPEEVGHRRTVAQLMDADSDAPQEASMENASSPRSGEDDARAAFVQGNEEVAETDRRVDGEEESAEGEGEDSSLRASPPGVASSASESARAEVPCKRGDEADGVGETFAPAFGGGQNSASLGEDASAFGDERDREETDPSLLDAADKWKARARKESAPETEMDDEGLEIARESSGGSRFADETPAGRVEDAPEVVSREVGAPPELIRELVAEVCPGDLILMESVGGDLPAWAPEVVDAARLDLLERQGDRQPPAPEEYLRLAILEVMLGRCDEATGHLKEALRHVSQIGSVLNALAVTSFLREKVEPAISYCREALREAGQDESIQAVVSQNLGYFYQYKGDDAEAAESYEMALGFLELRGRPEQIFSLRLRAGKLFWRLGNHEKARAHLSDAARLFDNLGKGGEEVRARVALASAQIGMGEYELAQASLKDSLEVCKKTEDRAGEALTYGQMGATFAAQYRFTRALQHYENSLELNRELENKEGEAANLAGMGDIHRARGDFAEAREAYEMALGINRKRGDARAEAKALWSLGRVCIEEGERETAREHLNEARRIFQELGASKALERVLETFQELDRHP